MDSTVIRGNSTDAGNPLGPFQATIIPFSWNLSGNQLPYSYTPDDPGQLQTIVSSPTAGAGAGVLKWAKTNWLITSYPATAPFIVSQPENLTLTPNQSASFTVVVGGSSPLHYQWYFNTNTPLPNATNAGLTLLNVQTTNAGIYSVVITNSAGSVTSTNAILTVSSGVPATPQISATFTNGVFNLSVSGNSGVDYIVQVSSNLLTWDSIFTNHSATPPFIFNDSDATNFNRRFYRVQIP
jgi:hypothetical protein